MTQITKAGKTGLINWWKNLSRFWSPKERRLQAVVTEIHTGIGGLLVADYPEYNDDVQPEVREVP